MNDSWQIIYPGEFKQLIANGSIRSAAVRMAENGQGLIVELDIGQAEPCVLGQQRGGPRYFRSFDGAASVLQQYGVSTWIAVSQSWTPRTQPTGSKIRRYENMTVTAS